MLTRLLFVGVFAALCTILFVLPADRPTLEALAVKSLVAELAAPPLPDGTTGALYSHRDADTAHPLDPRREIGSIELRATQDPPFGVEHVDALAGALRIQPSAIEQGPAGDWLRASLPDLDGEANLVLLVQTTDGGKRLRLLGPDGAAAVVDPAEGTTAERGLGSRMSLVPPLLAILLAFLLRSTLPSLMLGGLAGAFLLVPSGESSFRALEILFADIIWSQILRDDFHFFILGFVFLLSATVAVVTRMGGIDGMVQALVRFARSSRSVQGVAWLLGLSIFFDDYANTIVVGNSAGPLFDRMRVSRAKLAYIVDSTAAPMAGIAVLSTWVAYQISTYAPQLPAIGRSADEGYAIFLESLPYRSYCILALVLVGFVIFLGRDIGPMRAVEKRAREGESDALDSSGSAWTRVERAPWTRPSWINGVLPLLLMIVGTASLIWFYGVQGLAAAAADGEALALRAQEEGGLLYVRQVLAKSDSTRAIFFGSLSALVLAGVLALAQRQLPLGDLARTTTKGMAGLVKDGAMVLILAWTIGKVCQSLGTAEYLVAVFSDLIAPNWLPILLFITSGFVAFSTGSSWTTMAIMQPNVVLLSARLGEESAHGPNGLLVLCVGAVLEGAIFGDHCSPISDTTILSSAASRCKLMDHVRTQIPYALLGAVVALSVCYVPAAFFQAPPLLCLAAGAIILFVFMRFVGTPIPPARAAPPSAASGA